LLLTFYFYLFTFTFPRLIMDAPDYCRQIEAYLCRKNEGHLIRIVGPAFEQVCGWANLGVPLKVAFRGIDQYCDRYYAKGPRRRPVRIEFCEADILDLFDAWRRAIGVARADGEAIDEQATRKPALPAHIERAVAKLTGLRAGGARRASFDEQIDAIVRQLDHLAADARVARGDARAALIDRLRSLDDELIAAASREASPELTTTLTREAEAELAPFISRMPPPEIARARGRAMDRLLRDAFGLPLLAYE
jgi:hypothetical protein